MNRLWLRILAPLLVGGCFLGLWEGVVWLLAVPRYILPAPSDIAVARCW
jgi:ABC-type nitrate/sulfonate/bicarbonate transport system permease component